MTGKKCFSPYSIFGNKEQPFFFTRISISNHNERRRKEKHYMNWVVFHAIVRTSL